MKIAIRGLRDLIVIEQDDILYCQADGRYTRIFIVQGKSILTSHLLKEVELKLSPKGFCRIHHSYLINLNHITHIKGCKGITLKGGIHIPIAKRRQKEFFKGISRLDLEFV